MKTKLFLNFFNVILSARNKKTFGSNVSTIVLMILLSFNFCLLSSQVPQGFNYQALVRDGTGEIMAEEVLDVQIDIETAASTLIWSETYDDIQTTQYGLMSIVVGTGTPGGGSAPSFSEIDWNAEPLYLKTWIDIGSGMTEMGTTQIWAVPYSLVAKDVEGPIEKLGIKGTTTELDEALFEVKNNTGQTVFAVYNEGVRIYVDDGEKGVKGGFSIGGFGTDKGTSQPYLIVKPDTVRVYINQSGKGVKGGFAIGGYGTDKADIQDFLFISDDSVRIYVDNADTDEKGVKGGFAIGGYGTDKGYPQKLLTVSNDSVRIYIDDASKGPKGGFAIGGFDQTKGDGNNTNFFNVATSADDTINPAQNRILWYPVKNAFLTGKVLIEDPDSVGVNSFASGFESKAIGNYSQALGYKAIARGDYSTAIGKNAVASEINTFALGEDAKAGNSESYAFGRGAISNGYRSFSFGSAGIDTLGNPTDVTKALGDYSFAIGQGSISTGVGSIALGVADTASGDFSTALGTKSAALGDLSIVIGSYSTATNYCSTAMGYYTVASGRISTSMGQNTNASGPQSVAMGEFSQSIGRSSFAMGYSSRSNGAYSIAGGYGSKAGGLASFAMGTQSKTEGTNTTAIGQGAIAKGYYTAAIGRGTIARSRSSFVVGEYNDSITSSSTAFTWVDADPIFIIGNGQSNTSRQNAVTVLKNGNVGIGTVSPGTTLAVAGLTGTSSGSYLKVFNDDFYYASSSEKTKKDIEPLKEDFYKILNAQPVSFTDIATGERNIGYIAERFDELGLNNLVIYKDGEPMALSYELVSLYNLEIIKEQQEQIDSQDHKIEQLEQMILEMQEKIASSSR